MDNQNDERDEEIDEMREQLRVERLFVERLMGALRGEAKPCPDERYCIHDVERAFLVTWQTTRTMGSPLRTSMVDFWERMRRDLEEGP